MLKRRIEERRGREVLVLIWQVGLGIEVRWEVNLELKLGTGVVLERSW